MKVRQVYHVVIADCNDRIVGVYWGRACAQEWLKHWQNQGVQAVELRGPFKVVCHPP